VANSVYRYLRDAQEKQGWLVFRCTSCDRDRPMPEARVDHIKPLADGGADDMANIQVICNECHITKTTKENRERARNT
jgi:5-methylcytosine-specific restriction endonuclease McrA